MNPTISDHIATYVYIKIILMQIVLKSVNFGVIKNNLAEFKGAYIPVVHNVKLILSLNNK